MRFAGRVILAHDDDGSGPAAVLLHSGICDRRMWEAQAGALAVTHRVIRPDLRGFGDSPLPGERFSFGDDVVALLDHLEVDRAAFVGSSLGGRVALEVAVAHPVRVDSLVLLCPALRGIEPTRDAEAFGSEEDRLLASGDVAGAVELNVATWLGPEASSATRDRVRQMQRHAFEVQLAVEAAHPAPELVPVEVDPGRVTAPTLVVSGGRDLEHFRRIADHLATTLPKARLAELPWAAYLPSLERPDEVTELVAGFLSGR